MFMDDIKLLANNEKELETQIKVMRIYSEDRDGIWHSKVCQANIEKLKTTNDGRNRTTLQREN